MQKFPFLLFLLVWGIGSVTQAYRPPSVFNYNESLRQVGMGGVYIFDSSDAAGILQNPAYTCFNKGLNWKVIGLGAGVGVQGADSLSSLGATNTNSITIRNLDPLYGKQIWSGGNGNTSFALPCVGVSFYGSTDTSFLAYNPPFPNVDVSYIYDYAFVSGAAIPLGPFASVGMSVKRITRQGGVGTIGTSSLQSNVNFQNLSAFTNEGVGWGIDFGFVARLPEVPMNPTLSLSWKDAGSVNFVNTKGTGALDRLESNLILGATVSGEVPFAGFSLGAEYRHLLTQGVPTSNKIHVGTEISLMMLDLRAGVYQGYLTYGLGMDLWLFQVDAAYYSVEKGLYPGQAAENRFQAGLSIEFGFDPDFKLNEVGGRKRKLKQRR